MQLVRPSTPKLHTDNRIAAALCLFGRLRETPFAGNQTNRNLQEDLFLLRAG